MAGFSTISNKHNELIRKAINGSCFIAPITSSAITTLTSGTGGTSGTISASTSIGATSISSTVSFASGTTITIDTSTNAETTVTSGAPTGSGPYTIPVPALTKAHSSGVAVASPAVVSITSLPTGYVDAGWSDSSGVDIAQAITVSETDSWGSVEPTRSDITKQTTTAKIVMQETKALSIGLYTGVDTSTVQGDHVSGEVSVTVPAIPSANFYRMLTVAVDTYNGLEVYVARFLPRVKVTDKDDIKYALDDGGIPWGLTFTAYQDSTLGYSQRFLFGGPGWLALLQAGNTGFTQA